MKYYLIFSFIVFMCLKSLAQTDLSIEFMNYKNGDVFSEDKITTDFIITNKGNVTYNIGDILYVNSKIGGITYDLLLLSSDASPIVLKKTLNTNDTIHYYSGYIKGSETLPFYPGATTLEVCMIVWGEGLSSVSPSYGGDVNISNNTTCVTYDPSYVPTTDIANQADYNAYTIYPNPASHFINIHHLTNNSITAIKFYNYQGQLVFEQSNYNESENINTTTWENGIYLYSIYTTKGELYSGKICIEK
jgi:hypothetical protein